MSLASATIAEPLQLTTSSVFLSEVSSSSRELNYRVSYYILVMATQLEGADSYAFYPQAICFKPISLLTPFATELRAPPQIVGMRVWMSAPASNVTVLYGLPVALGEGVGAGYQVPKPSIVATRTTNFLGPAGTSGSTGLRAIVSDQKWTLVGEFNRNTLNESTAQLLRDGPTGDANNMHCGTLAFVHPTTGAPLSTEMDVTLRIEISLRQALPTIVPVLGDIRTGGASNPDQAWNTVPDGGTSPASVPGQITSMGVTSID
jgi:hypothetical protein